MPLQVASIKLGLPVPVVRVAVPHWLFAETMNLQGLTMMVVNRSPLVRDTDPVYSDVADLLARTYPQLLWRATFPDPAMYWGEHEVSCYLLHESEVWSIPDDPRVQSVIDICATWTRPMMPADVGEEFARRLALYDLAEMV